MHRYRNRLSKPTGVPAEPPKRRIDERRSTAQLIAESRAVSHSQRLCPVLEASVLGTIGSGVSSVRRR
eukprot:6180944-Prorocentrum_lima.AAC.1